MGALIRRWSPQNELGEPLLSDVPRRITVQASCPSEVFLDRHRATCELWYMNAFERAGDAVTIDAVPN